MYAIVKTGGKQYRVEEGQSLLVERLPVGDGGKVALEPLLYVDGSTVVDGEEGRARVTVEARVLAHERGPKLRVVKFKPKRGYRRRTGHRQELTRIEVTAVKLAARRGKAGASARADAEPREAASEPVPAEAAPATRRSSRSGGGAAGRPKRDPGAASGSGRTKREGDSVAPKTGRAKREGDSVAPKTGRAKRDAGAAPAKAARTKRTPKPAPGGSDGA